MVNWRSEWLGSRVVSVLDSGAEGPGFKSQPRRCRVTVLGKLLTVPCRLIVVWFAVRFPDSLDPRAAVRTVHSVGF